MDGGVETAGEARTGHSRGSVSGVAPVMSELLELTTWLGQTHLNLTPGMLLSLSCRIFAELKSFIVIAKMGPDSQYNGIEVFKVLRAHAYTCETVYYNYWLAKH